MPLPKRDGLSGGGNSGKTDNRTHNGIASVSRPATFDANGYLPAGSRADFRTDTAISNKRFGNERTLQPWIPDADDNFDGSLDHSAKSGAWDQFAENERRFGIKSNYDESFYTTSIDKSHPQYRERMAAAEKKAREIERSAAVTTHVAEERVMDYVGGANAEDDNEEDKSVVSPSGRQPTDELILDTAVCVVKITRLSLMVDRASTPRQPNGLRLANAQPRVHPLTLPSFHLKSELRIRKRLLRHQNKAD